MASPSHAPSSPHEVVNIMAGRFGKAYRSARRDLWRLDGVDAFPELFACCARVLQLCGEILLPRPLGSSSPLGAARRDVRELVEALVLIAESHGDIVAPHVLGSRSPCSAAPVSSCSVNVRTRTSLAPEGSTLPDPLRVELVAQDRGVDILSINDPWARPPAVAQPCDSINPMINCESEQGVIIGSSAEVLLEDKPFESVHSVAGAAAGSHCLVGEDSFFASGAAARPASAGQVLAIFGSAAEVATFARSMGFGALAPSFPAQLPMPCGINFNDLPGSQSSSDVSSHDTCEGAGLPIGASSLSCASAEEPSSTCPACSSGSVAAVIASAMKISDGVDVASSASIGLMASSFGLASALGLVAATSASAVPVSAGVASTSPSLASPSSCCQVAGILPTSAPEEFSLFGQCDAPSAASASCGQGGALSADSASLAEEADIGFEKPSWAKKKRMRRHRKRLVMALKVMPKSDKGASATCPECHPLFEHNGENEDEFRFCDSCGARDLEHTWSCFICEHDICSDCYDTLVHRLS